jgi:hypothetical protein
VSSWLPLRGKNDYALGNFPESTIGLLKIRKGKKFNVINKKKYTKILILYVTVAELWQLLNCFIIPPCIFQIFYTITKKL